MWRLVIALIVVSCASCATSNLVVKHGLPDVYDFRVFANDKIHKSDKPYHFAQIPNITLPPAATWVVGKDLESNVSSEKYLADNGTLGLLILKNDTVMYENYFNGHTVDSLSQVFSVTKTFISTLVGIAVSEGKMKTDQLVGEYLPFMAHGRKAKITINHLLNMTSGLRFCDFKTAGTLLKFYYTDDEVKMLKNARVKYDAGTHFAYCSMNTEMLGLCLEKAVGMSVAKYMELKIWKPLGMERDAQISLDKEGGNARMYAGLASNVRDLAKLGRLFLNNGMWEGKQIIPAEWVNTCRKRNTTNGSSSSYTNCWWLDTYSDVTKACDKNDQFAGGYRGQFIYINPEEKTVVVRLGTKEPNGSWPYSISKLGSIPLTTAAHTTSLAGEYKNKSGQRIAVTMDGATAVINAYGAMGKLELTRQNGYSFINRKRKMKLLVNYNNNEVSGVILEAGTKSDFFKKI